MNKREALRQAHAVADMLIRQAQRSTEGWADDQADHDAIDAALSELAVRHYRASGGVDYIAKESPR